MHWVLPSVLPIMRRYQK